MNEVIYIIIHLFDNLNFIISLKVTRTKILKKIQKLKNFKKHLKQYLNNNVNHNNNIIHKCYIMIINLKLNHLLLFIILNFKK